MSWVFDFVAKSNHNIRLSSGVLEDVGMSRCKSITLVALLLVSSLSGIAFNFDENNTAEGQLNSNPEELNLLQQQTMLNVQGAWGGGGTTGSDIGEGIATDSNGNAYVAGYFVGTATFGSTSLVSSGSDDIFIAKLNSSGSWQWAVKAGGSGSDKGYGIAVDSSGNTYVTGTFFGTATFGNTSLISSGYYDIFIAKLSSSGTWQWAVKAASTSGNAGNAIAVDSSGNTYVTGYFHQTTTFGSISLVSSGSADIFIAKLDTNGSWQWAVKAGGSGADRGYGITIDSSGNAYSTGYITGTATFGSTSLVSSGGIDIFIAKLNSGGSWQWAVKAGSTGSDVGYGIAVDSNGNAYATGSFTGTAAFGSTSLTSNGGDDIFIAKLSSSGSWQWAVKAGGSGHEKGDGIAVDSNDNAYVTGYFNNAATFGRTSFSDDGGNNEIFVAKLSSSGSWQWVAKAGGSSEDYGKGIAVDSNGNAYVTGYFEGTATFRGNSLTSTGGQDTFVWITQAGPMISSVSPDDSNPDGNVTATITGYDFQWLNQTFSKNITVSNSGNSTLNNHVITVENPVYNDSGLVGSWHFDESSGTVVDTSGNGNNGTAYGGPTYGVEGVDGTAIELDGTNDYFVVPDDDSLDLGTGDFTLSAWVKPESISNYDRIFHKDELTLKYTSSTWSADFGESGGPVYMTSYGPGLNEWVLATLVRDSSGITPMIYFYLDGVEIYTTTSTSVNLTTTEPLYIGAEYYSSGSVGDFLDGSLDALKIYNRALSDDEILSQYRHGAMYNYWDVGFSDSNGIALPHTMPTDGEFQIEIPQISANSSIDITIEYGQNTLTNQNLNTTNQSSDMTNLSISVGPESTNLGVTFGNTASNYVEYIDKNTINVSVPPNLIGVVNLTITDANGYSHTLVNGFTYYGISSLNPNFGDASGGTNVTVTGAGFDDFTHYRMPVTITNPTASAITNSAVNIPLPLYNESDLSASWHFDEASGAIIDSGGNGNNATTYGNPTYGADGIDALAMNFDGVDDALMIPDDDSLDMGTGDFTISFWIKIDEADYTNQRVFRKGNYDFSLIQYSDTKWTAYAGSGTQSLTINQAPVEDEWTHIVFRRETNYAGNANQIQLSFAINGVESATTNFGSAPLNISNSDPLVIGASRDATTGGPNNCWINASLDELKFHKRFMNDSEVTSLYQGGIAMRNYWDVQFRNEGGELLNHSMDSDGTFQVEISSIAAASSQVVYAEYGRTVSSPSFTSVPTVSASLQAVVGTEDANAVNLSLGGVIQPSATMINSTTLQFTTVAQAGGLMNMSISQGSKSFTLANAFRFSDCINGNSTQDRWGCPDADGDGYSDPDSNGIYGPVWNITDGADNCVNIANVNQSDYENDLIGDACDNDDDNDTVADIDDECQYGTINWTSSGSTDIDSDGCQDTVEDTPLVSYPNSIYEFRSNLTTVSLILSNVGTSTSNFSISPDISPLNLSFNSNTGEISGIANSSRITVNYTIWANNSFGNNYTNLMISVGEPIPTNILYPSLNPVFTVDVSLGGGWNPTQTGGIINSWAIQPISNLTAINLSFNNSTGAISGTPSGNMSITTFMVSATNLAGTAYANISITVVHSLDNISYSLNEYNLTVGSSATILTNESGNSITHWSIQPLFNLTAVNLSFNTFTGTISGTPSGNMGITIFMVSATNDNGTVNTNITIVIVHPLDPISYPQNDYNLTNGTAIVINPDLNDAGFDSWDINPTLPAGLTLNSSSGEISGTPSVNSSLRTYTLTAYNDNGSVITTINIVIVNPVTEISYPQTHYNVTKGVPFSIIPDLNGVGVILWSILDSTGSEPSAEVFTIDHLSGEISGTPAFSLSNTTYTVYATNDNGTTSFTLSIWILEDGDGDGVADIFDPFETDSSQWADTDGDNYGDNATGNNPDSCVDVWGDSVFDRTGCPDSDGDGYSDPDQNWTWMDGADNFTNETSQWADQDGDGYGDNLSGNEPDMFQINPTQWNDTDGDGYGDNYNWSLTDSRDSSWPGERMNDAYQIDRFPLDSSQWNDTDDDGYGDNESGYQADACPETLGNSSIEFFGCIDGDGDGVRDDDDAFPTDPLRSRDIDSDGFDDGNDDCWDIAGNSTEDRTGCVDSDGDGYSNSDLNWSIEDGADALPDDTSQWLDQDGDGFGDGSTGFQPDACLGEIGNSTTPVFGCPDRDGDGVADSSDAFPDDKLRSGDEDDDGFDNDEDDCFNTPGTSTGMFNGTPSPEGMKGCPDQDNDGWADSEDEEPNDPQQIIDTTPPPISTLWNVSDEDFDGGVLLILLSHLGDDWDDLEEWDRPVSLKVRYSTNSISDCSGAVVNGPEEDALELDRPPSVIRFENLTDGQEYYLCLFVSDIRGNEYILGPESAIPTLNEAPLYNGGLTNEIAYIGELWILNLCDYFTDEETACEELEVSSSTNRLGINQFNKSVSWRPTGSDASIMNITFTVCDSGLVPLCVSSNPINIGVETQPQSSGGNGASGGYLIDIPILGEMEVSMESIAGIIGSTFIGVFTVLLAVIKFRHSRYAKKRVSQLIKEIRITKNVKTLDALLDDATRLYTKDRINTEDYSLIDGHIEKRRDALTQDAIAPPQNRQTKPTPSIDAKGKVRSDGYEWLEHPAESEVWWYRAPETGSWSKWKD